MEEARAQVAQQASEQQQRVAGGLHSLGTELRSMADRSDESGTATELARQAADTVHEVADWLEQRDPSSLLHEVKTFARRRPGTFLAIALGAGLVAGRLARGLRDETADQDGSSAPAGSYGGDGVGTAAASSSAPAASGAGLGTAYPPAAPRETAGEYAETEYIETSYPATATTPVVGRYDEGLPAGDVVEPPLYPAESPRTDISPPPRADQEARVEKTTGPNEERR